MKNVKKFLGILSLAGFAFGCGVSSVDAGRELEASAFSQEVCGYEGHQAEEEDLADVEKLFVPDGFGITSTYGCSISAQWPGLQCRIPFSKTFDMKIAGDGQDGTWLIYLDDARDSVIYTANNNGWNINEYDGAAPFQFRTSTTHPDGWLGYAQMNSVTTVLHGDQGAYRIHARCLAVLYRTAIEANTAYQAASPAQKARYIRNLAKHEMYHCLGLAHSQGTSNTLMSQAYTFPGPFYNNPLSPTAVEQQRMQDFVP